MTTCWDAQVRRTLLMALVALGSLMRAFVCFQHNPLDYLSSDPNRHWLNGERLWNPDLMGASDPILYQVYIYLLRIFTSDDRIGIAAMCGILSVLMPWTYARAARDFGLSWNASLLVWGLIAWMPSLSTIYHYTMTETLLLPLIGVSLWMTARHLRKGTQGSFLIAVLCWTLACLTKASAVPLAILCLIYAWWKASRRMSFALVGLALGALLLTPNAIRTRHYLGFIAPFGNPWIGKILRKSGARIIEIKWRQGRWGFSPPSFGGQPLAPLSAWMPRSARGDTVVGVEANPIHGAKDWQAAYDRLTPSWNERLAQMEDNALLFLFSPSWPDNNNNEWDGWLAIQNRWLWAPLIFVVLILNVRQFHARKWDLIPLATTAFICLLAFQSVVPMEGRYRKPLEPLLLLNLVWVLVPLGQDRRGGASQPRMGSSLANPPTHSGVCGLHAAVFAKDT